MSCRADRARTTSLSVDPPRRRHEGAGRRPNRAGLRGRSGRPVSGSGPAASPGAPARSGAAWRRPQRRPRRRAGCPTHAATHCARRTGCHGSRRRRMLHGEIGSQPHLQASQPADCRFERLSMSAHIPSPRSLVANLLASFAACKPLAESYSPDRPAGATHATGRGCRHDGASGQGSPGAGIPLGGGIRPPARVPAVRSGHSPASRSPLPGSAGMVMWPTVGSGPHAAITRRWTTWWNVPGEGAGPGGSRMGGPWSGRPRCTTRIDCRTDPRRVDGG